MELKDVFHFYLGMSTPLAVTNPFGTIEHLRPGSYEQFRDAIILNCKPHFRPLSDIKDYEYAYMEQNFPAIDADRNKSEVEKAAIKTTWLINQGFDLFGQIESGQAIDSTKL